MARQNGIFKIEGTLGGVTFFKTADGHLVREKGGLDANRIKNDPAFQRTRENGDEFGRAGKAGALLRQAVRPLLQLSKDRLVSSRLLAEMIKVIRADAGSERGLRNVIDGETEMLQGFDFNVNAKFSSSFYAPYETLMNRGSGELTITLSSFIPAQVVAAPAGTSHFKIVSAGTAVDFTNGRFVTAINEAGPLPWTNTVGEPIKLVHQIEAGSPHPLFLLMGIQFYQQVNATMYPLKSGSYNSLVILKVEGV